MKASRCIRLWVGLFFLGVTIHSVTAASNDIHVVVDNVFDMRSSGNSLPRCRLELTFSGGDVADAFGIRQVQVTNAVDDTGHNLRLDSEAENMQNGFFPNSGYGSQTSHSVSLASPSRDAHSIKLLEGEADLFFPTPENGGMVIVKDFLAHPGEAYNDPLLKKSNVTIAYLGKDGSETNTGDNTASGIPVTSVQMGRRIAFRRSGQMKGYRFAIEDPDHRLVDMLFLDAYGRQVSAGMSSFGNGYRVYQFQGEASSKLRLYIYLATPDAIKTVPFKVENIALP